MIFVRCANGVVAFRVQFLRSTDSHQWTCENDGSSGTQPRTPTGYQQLIRDMNTKATSLAGNVLQVVDIGEIV